MTPESWHCIDCGYDTAPGCYDRAKMEKALAASGSVISTADGVDQTVDDRSEIYMVRDKVWRQAGMGPNSGCLCIGCLERRIKRPLKLEDFPRRHPLNTMPGTPRLMKLRGQR
ncbi:MAG: hypothetical protein C0480_22855 [Bradyrhizobium sp.]|nr:hypothetical protein [Bradyrhizobium sp.]